MDDMDDSYMDNYIVMIIYIWIVKYMNISG